MDGAAERDDAVLLAKRWEMAHADQEDIVDRVTAERDRLAKMRRQAVEDLRREHRPDDSIGGQGGCVMCWPKDGSWPCWTRMIADELEGSDQ